MHGSKCWGEVEAYFWHLDEVEYQHYTLLNLGMMADHVSYTFLAFLKLKFLVRVSLRPSYEAAVLVFSCGKQLYK